MTQAAWYTVGFLILLAPGFAVFFGLYSHRRISREVGFHSTLTYLISILVLSFLLHSVLVPLATTACSWLPSSWGCPGPGLLARLLVPPADVQSADEVLASLQDGHWWLLGYFLLSGTVGAIAGRWAGEIILRTGLLHGAMSHVWALRLYAPSPWQWSQRIIRWWKGSGGPSAYEIAHVVTGLSHEGRHVLYWGYLEEVYLNRDGTPAYLILALPHRYYMVLEQEVPAISQTRASVTNLGVPKAVSYLYIPGSEIRNVLFDKVVVENPREFEHALDEALSGQKEDKSGGASSAD